jgi:hypothetical protein
MQLLHTRRRTRALLAFWLMLGASALGQEPAGAGPKNHGLRLKLTLATTRPRGVDEHTVRLELFNVGTRAVTLVADWPYEGLGDYAEFLRSEISFITFPEVQPEGAQTAGAFRSSPQPRHTLQPGKSLTVRWTARGPRLKPEACFDEANTSPHFPADGLYSVRGQLVVRTAEGGRILLVSNDQPVMVGGSARLPKHATAEVVETDAASKTCRISLGSDHGLTRGDVFLLRYGLAASWQLTLTQVEASGAVGTVQLIHRTDGAGIPAFPKESWLATLVPHKALQGATTLQE